MSSLVRRAEPPDAPTLLALIDALADYEKLPRPDEGARRRLVTDAFEIRPPRFETYLAFPQEGAPAVGYVIVFETYSTFLAQPTLYLEDFFVLPEARGTGVGGALFEHVAAEAVRRGCGRMEWTCLDWNELAIGFYERRGARHLDDWRFYRLTGPALTQVARGEGCP
jgi:GNAT superfamily N-acetyltransferase